MERAKSPVQRCAVYTRKSSEEGLEQDFNSLQAQREACEAFIKSQAGEGWRLVKTAYDDGGISGGTMERPALQRLLSDIDEGRIDVVVVYKVDRLTRSLADFAKMVEIFDAHDVSFVSITQQFNTTTSMGRLTLNVLLSFAQFQREVTGERIRDKIAASKKKGMWMGGCCSIGYDVRDRRLVVNQEESKLVRHIYKRYLDLGSVRLLKRDLDRREIVSKIRISKNGTRWGGRPFSRGALYELLANPIYIGEIRHKKVRHPGQHKSIVDRRTWRRCRSAFATKPRETACRRSGLLRTSWRASCSMSRANRYIRRGRRASTVAVTGTMFLASWSEAAVPRWERRKAGGSLHRSWNKASSFRLAASSTTREPLRPRCRKPAFRQLRLILSLKQPTLRARCWNRACKRQPPSLNLLTESI